MNMLNIQKPENITVKLKNKPAKSSLLVNIFSNDEVFKYIITIVNDFSHGEGNNLFGGKRNFTNISR
jgi:hypothetical protein